MHHLMKGILTTKNFFASASAERRKKEQDYYLQNGSSVLEELLALCDGNCRIPIRYFTAIEIENAIKHSKRNSELCARYMVTGSLDNRSVFVRFHRWSIDNNIHRDIAITAQMSHLKNVLRLIGCSLEFESPVMVYEYVEGIPLTDLLFKSSHAQTRKSLSWSNRLRIAYDIASAIVFLHTEFTTPIIHRDIKPDNVIIDQNRGVAKIVDFSLSISLPPGKLEVEEDYLSGTIGYFPPEYVHQAIVSQKTDVYSFGVLLLELLAGKILYHIMESHAEEGNVMDRVDSAEEDPMDLEEDAESNIDQGNSMDRVDSAEEDPMDLEEDAESNIDQGNSMDRVDSTFLKYFDSENFLPKLIDSYIKEGKIMDIADHAILEERGIEIQQQLEDYLVLVKKCTADKGEDRPYMIHVAKELRRIENCLRAQN